MLVIRWSAILSMAHRRVQVLSDRQRCAILDFGRQALHAYMLGFIHPVTGEAMKFHAPLPKDYAAAN